MVTSKYERPFPPPGLYMCVRVCFSSSSSFSSKNLFFDFSPQIMLPQRSFNFEVQVVKCIRLKRRFIRSRKTEVNKLQTRTHRSCEREQQQKCRSNEEDDELLSIYFMGGATEFVNVSLLYDGVCCHLVSKCCKCFFPNGVICWTNSPHIQADQNQLTLFDAQRCLQL